METNTLITREDLAKFISDKGFVFGDYGDYETNVGIMSEAVQSMGRDRYIEEMQPALSDDSGYVVADYYDSIVKDVIVFDVEVSWNFFESAEQVAEYLFELNKRYNETKTNYENMYTISDCFKKIFSLFKND